MRWGTHPTQYGAYDSPSDQIHSSASWLLLRFLHIYILVCVRNRIVGRTDVEAETPILWPPDAKSWLIGKDPDAGKD